MGDSDSSHLIYANKIASNDLDVRTSTLKTLASFFSKSGKLEEKDLTKIWMGLWYSMWMSDKPTVQRELAEAISKLIHSHSNTDNAMMFVKVFYTTMHREFSKIDRLRYDKFLKFVRIFVHHSLLYIKNKDYDSDLIDKYHKAQTVVWELDDAQEIQLHVCDMFFEELYLACGNTVPSDTMFQYATLFADTLEKTNHKILKGRLFDTLKAFILGAAYCSPKLAPKNFKGLDSNKDMFPDIEFINVTLDELEKWFMGRASKQGNFMNRELFYDLHDIALRKSRAEPGFKLVPRGSIEKKVQQAEEEEYDRLMKEYAESKGEDESEVKTKKELKRERQVKQREKMAKEQADREKAEKAAQEPAVEEGNKKKRNRKRKAEPEAPEPVVAAPPSASKTVVSVKQVKKNAKGEVISKTEETTQTIVTKDAEKVVTEVTKTKKVKETKKGNKQQAEEVVSEPQQEEEEVAVAVTPKGGKKNKKAQPNQTETQQTKSKPVPVPAAPANEPKAQQKRKSSEPETTPTTTIANGKKRKTIPDEVAEEPNGNHAKAKGKGKKGKAKVEETVEEAQDVEEVQEAEEVEESQGITPKGKGKKGKKGKKETTPAKIIAETPGSSRKSVRFSNDNLIKEFDKSQALGKSPATPTTTPVKLKSLLTPPSKKNK